MRKQSKIRKVRRKGHRPITLHRVKHTPAEVKASVIRYLLRGGM